MQFQPIVEAMVSQQMRPGRLDPVIIRRRYTPTELVYDLQITPRMSIKSFRDLEVWQYSKALAIHVYRATEALDWPHRMEIGGQMRRSSVSTPSNIAEGFRQGSLRAYLHHVRIAAGSTAELETQAEIATDLQLWTVDYGREIAEMADRSGRMLTGLIASLDRRLQDDLATRGRSR